MYVLNLSQTHGPNSLTFPYYFFFFTEKIPKFRSEEHNWPSSAEPERLFVCDSEELAHFPIN